MKKYYYLRMWFGVALIAGFFMAPPSEARDLSKEYQKTELRVGHLKVSAFIADDDAKREKGLMFIKSLDENEGMIFVFDEEKPLSFWMKNTEIPLSIGYFNQKGLLIDVQEMVVANSVVERFPMSYPSKGPAKFALEMNKNWFAKNKVPLGVQLKLKTKSPSSLLNSALSPALQKK